MNDMASKIIWGPSQTIAVWSVDTDSAAEWRIRKDEHFDKMIQSRLVQRVANLVVEVVEKPGYQQINSSNRSVGTSGVTSAADVPQYGEGAGDTFTSQEEFQEAEYVVDWSTLTVIPEADQDGEATAIVDEDIVFEAMGFKAADERAQEAVERAIPVIPPEEQNDMDEVGINVDDTEPTELVLDWDRNNPDMMVGTVYPTMTDFRMAVRQHAIVHEFELGTKKSDKTRFKGFGKATGCPWKIRARTQDDGSVRVYLLSILCICRMFLFS